MRLLVVGFAVAGCERGVVSEVLLEEFPVASPSVGASVDAEYVGRVHAVRQVEFRARLKGTVEVQGVDEGQEVKAGQVLFAISSRELQAELEKARAAVESAAVAVRVAELEQDNTKLLLENKVISTVEHQVAQAKVAEAAAGLREAKAHEAQAAINLSWAQVRAPFDGIVNRVPRKLGSHVSEGDALTSLTDISEVFVYFRVSEREYLELVARGAPTQQQRVTVRLANGETYGHEGTIDAVESEFDRESGTIAFRARVPNPGRVLRHGATAKIVIRTEAKDRLVVPQRATFEIQDNVYVFRVDADDTVHATQIVPWARLKDSFVVESGLAPGDRFVLEGVQKLRDGARIIARAAPSSPRAL